jgi:hypothetical protein
MLSPGWEGWAYVGHAFFSVKFSTMGSKYQSNAGMDSLRGAGGDTPLALARGGSGGGVLFFMIKQKNIRDKMRYSNLSNNMIISRFMNTEIFA